MKRYRIYAPAVAAVLIFGVCSMGLAQQPTSDYEIQQDFKQEYRTLSNDIEEAESTGELEETIDSIEELEDTYSSHREFLDKVLYPDTFNGQVQELKDRASLARERLTTIEEQEAKMSDLTDQLDAFNNKLADINDETESLREKIKKTEESERQLSSMVQRYRQNLEERDELVLAFVDSVMISYQNLDLQSMQDLESAQKKARLESDGNALQMIERIASENVDFLNNNSQLSTEEYLRMNAVQKQFSTMWSRVGDKLVRIYEPDNPDEAETQIENALAEWDEKVTTLTWDSLNEAFESSGISLPEFADNDAFFSALNSYLDESIEESRGNNSQSQLERYQTFYTFWNNEVQSDWSPYFDEGEILSNRQMATIDQKVTQWAAHAEPESNLLVYLLGFSVLAIVFLGVMLARQKSDKN